MTIVPDTESIRRAIAEAEAEDAYWREHYAALLELFPDQFVAVARANGHVVAANEDLYALIEEIKQQGLTVQDVWSKFMFATPVHLSL